MIADICSSAGLYEPALQFIESSVGTDSAERDLFRGRCLFQLGRMDEAAATFQRVDRTQRTWATASLWLAYVGLALESPALVAKVEQSWGQLHPENQRLLDLISFLLGGPKPVENTPRLVLPLLKSVAPHITQAALLRCLQLVEECPGFDQWFELTSTLFRGYGQVDLAWRAYSHRPAQAHEPWLEAAMHQVQGNTHQALKAYWQILPDARVQIDDFLQASRLCLKLAQDQVAQGGGNNAD
jgi:tetratricopeptide (TPR) repeat protein